MKDLAIILGIRPDVIRASKILNLLAESSEITYDFIWSGQHYSDNMKDVFFSQLNVPKPDFEFEIDTTNDSTIVSSIIKNTYEHLDKNKYKAVIFLGDTNTVMGCIGVIQHNIPVVHIEGCMRSYDWRMPEEKYRTTIDHLSDRIYAYLDSYKQQGLNEGISENVINVTGNPIVDIINDNHEIFDTGGEHLDDKILNFIKNDNFTLATSHRRENILDQKSLTNIDLKSNVLVTDPIGYLEFMYLMKNSNYVISDSGTVVEEACIIGKPSIQMRHSTERPEVYDVGSSIKFDPSEEIKDFEIYISKVNKLTSNEWKQPFGDGNSSEKIVNDLIELSSTDTFNKHNRNDYAYDVSNAFKE